MEKKNKTTIQIDKEVLDELYVLKKRNQSYSDIIRELIVYYKKV